MAGYTVVLNTERDVTITYAIPADATVTSATMSGGSNLGAGTPSLTQTDGVIQLSLPGPFTAGDTVVPPQVTLDLHATGAISSSILTEIYTGSAAFTYTPNVTAVGSTFDAPTTCSPASSPVLAHDRDRRRRRPRPAG